MFNIFRKSFIFLNQRKDVSTTVIGIGANVMKTKDEMKKAAGRKGKVLLYDDFDALSSQFEEMLKASCGKCIVQTRKMENRVLIHCQFT